MWGGAERFQDDPAWRDSLLFFEYFNGDDGAGLGASHQTGWTGLIANLILERVRDRADGGRGPERAERPAASASAPPPETPAQPGMHPAEWSAEFLGTFAVLLVGLSAVCFDFGSASPLHALPTSLRLLLTGLVFAATGSLFALTPPGRRSGAHLNPVVTLTFWSQRKVHWHDLIGYLAAQFARRDPRRRDRPRRRGVRRRSASTSARRSRAPASARRRRCCSRPR